jgi:hypothetical protein
VSTVTNRVWATADDAVTLISGTNKTLTARVIDTAGNFTALPLSDNSYTLDTSAGQSNFNLAITGNAIPFYARVTTYSHGVCAC